MTNEAQEHNEQVKKNIARREQLDRIYGHLPPDQIAAIQAYLRKSADAHIAQGDALTAYRDLSADARKALKTADAEGLLRVSA